MTAALKWNLISVEDYLAAEMISPTKHEYVGGVVHGMAGGRIAHNVIKGNIFGYSFARLRGNRCRPFDSDMRIRVDFSDHIRFYYPDVSVICRSNPPTDSFQDQPVVIFEVLSKKTRRIDIGEKKDAYLTISWWSFAERIPALCAKCTRGSTPCYRSPRLKSICLYRRSTTRWNSSRNQTKTMRRHDPRNRSQVRLRAVPNQTERVS
jgi:hypothetical protein